MPVLLCVLLAAFVCVQTLDVQVAKADTTQYITYARTVYAGTSDSLLNLQGNAGIHDSGLYLTGHGSIEIGSAFFNEKVKSTAGFSAFFQFKLENRGPSSLANSSQRGADGIVFIISSAANQYGSEGQGIGYQSIGNSVGVEFDTYKNSTDAWENSESHIAIDVNGVDIVTTPPAAYAMLADGYFNNDGPFYAWIDYNADSHTMEVRINTDDTRPSSATLTTTINLSTYAGDEYYVGFTSATGGSVEDHIIKQWDFSNTYVPGGLSATGSYAMDSTPPNAPTLTPNGNTVTLSGSADSESGLSGYEYKVDGGSWTPGDTVDVSGLSNGTHTILGRAIDNVGNISDTTTCSYEKSPQISVKGNGTVITNGDVAPSSSDYTDYGAVAVGSELERTFVIYNTGTSPLNLTGAPIVSLNGSTVFTVSSQPSTPIAAGGSASFTVKFTPASTEAASATLSIASDDSPNNPYSFIIAGNLPEISVKGNGTVIANGDTTPSSADSTNYGTVAVGHELERTFVIYNTGSSPLYLPGDPIVSLSGSSDFTVSSQPSTPIAAGGSASFTVKFTPASTNAANATLSIVSNDITAVPYTYTIAGNLPEISVKGNETVIANGDTGSSYTDYTNFGTVAVGHELERTFVIYNTGSSPLNLTGGRVLLSGSPDFTISSLPETPIAAGGSASFKVKFTPTSTDAASATVRIESDDAENALYAFAISGNLPQSSSSEQTDNTQSKISVKGNGIVIASGDTTPSSSDYTSFGTVAVGSELERTFVISNTGTSTLTLTNNPLVSLSGSSDFAVSVQPATTIAPGENATFKIKYTPTSGSAAKATVIISSDDAANSSYTFVILGNMINCPTTGDAEPGMWPLWAGVSLAGAAIILAEALRKRQKSRA